MSKEVILVVDDNRQMVDFWVRTVLPSLGYETLAAYSGMSAMETIKKRPPSLILLDYQLPDMSGLDVLRFLSKAGHNIPILLITANGSEEIAAEAFRLGAQDYLIKPLDVDRLETAISRALTESRLRREKNSLTAQLTEQVSWLTVLSRIGKSITSSLEVDEVLRRIVEASVQFTHAEEGFLALLEEQTDQLYLRAVKNIEEEKIKTIHLPVTDTLIGDVMRTGQPYRTIRDPEDPMIKVSTGFLVHSLLHVPILSKGKSLGVLSVVNPSSQQEFEEKDEALLTSLADYAAVAIENATLYEQAQQEIQERRRIEEALRDSEERYALAVRGANDGIWDWDLRTNRIYYSPRWKSMLGYSEDEIKDDPDEWFKHVHPDDVEKIRIDIAAHISKTTTHFENEYRIMHKDGEYRWMISRGLAVWDNEGYATRIAGSQTDITDRKNAEQKLLHDAFYDSLTGLPNRALFTDRLNYAIERAKRREDYGFAVLFMDIDRFKDINDSLGHLMGDQLLKVIAKTLLSGIRATDTVARFGGDEFVILMDDIRDASNAIRVANWIQNQYTSPINLKDHDVFVTTSIGIVLSATGYHRPEDVLRDADIAMYSAKAKGKARYEIFEPGMRDRILERLSLESDLRRAIDNQELRVHYQVIVSLSTKKMIGFEALVRWQHPQRGLIPPMEFIPMAEETGLVIPVDRWVMREACRQMIEWQQRIPAAKDLTISVNLSGKHVAQPDLIQYIEEVLSESGLEPRSLKLEITESAILENNEITTEVFTRLKKLGVQIQIDDFGIGYSSLGYLSHFPIDALKIDQSFVRMIAEDSNNLKIVQAIVMLSHRLGVGVIAEGIETQDQLTQLVSLGCEYGQGYLVSLPLDNKSAEELLTNTVNGSSSAIPGEIQQDS
jgi:diguanylate cyclase (GGDEF)-like protein/PAS domain S-box-containing protein